MKNKTIELNISHLIMGVIILLLLWLLLKPTNIDLSKYDKQKKEIDSLGVVISELQKEQIRLDQSILQSKNKIDSLNNEVNNTNQEIINVREYYGKKIRDILNYTPQQLDDFFSKRYK